MDLIQSAGRIWQLPFGEETDRPVLGYVQGDRYALMVDAGNSAAHVKLFMDALDRHNLPRPAFVALTHAHWDHCFGLHAVCAASIACARTDARLEAMKNWAWTDEAMAARLESGEEIEFADRMIRKEYPDRRWIQVRTADVTFEDELALHLGGIDVQLLRLECSHSDDCVAVYVPQARFLFLGDAACENLQGHEPRHDPDKLRSLIAALEKLDFETCIEGHWTACSKAEVLSELRASLDAL